MTTEQAFLLYSTIASFLFLQGACITAGNRQFSMHYKSHGLIKRESIFKLIYFKPNHFHRYSIWEVLFFFASYIQLFIFLAVFFASFSIDISKVGAIISFSFMILSVISELVRIIYVDISRKNEEKNMKYRRNANIIDSDNKVFKAMLDYAQTTRSQLETLYEKELENLSTEDLESIDAVDEKYINYFRNYKDICFIKDEIAFKNHKVIRYDIECKFYGDKRDTFPDLNCSNYMPHLVIRGTKDYLGIIFESSNFSEFDLAGEAKIRTIYDLEIYDLLKEKTEFTIREGNKIVGEGHIISIIN